MALGGFLILVLINGVLMSWLRGTYSVVRYWDQNKIEFYEEPLRDLVPRGTSVFGDHRLVFLAHELEWDFVGRFVMIGLDNTEWMEGTSIEVVVLSAGVEWPRFLDREDFSLLRRLQAPPPRFDLPPYGYRTPGLTLEVFRKSHRVTS